MDPLRCLRNCTLYNRLDEVKFVQEQARVQFGREYEFPSDVKTNFVSSISNQPYALCSLLFYIQNRHLPPADYVKQALKARIATIYTADQEILKSFLKGEHELESVEQPTHKRTLDASDTAIHQAAPQKIRRKDLERNLRSRENLLVLPHKDFSNVLNVYNAAERVYTEQRKVQKNSKNKDTSAQANRTSNRMDRHTAASEQHKQLDVKIYGDRAPTKQTPQKPSRKPSNPHSHAPSRHVPSRSAPPAKEKPIIIVPEGYTALISLFNVKELLQDGKLVQSEEAAKAGEPKPLMVPITRPGASDRKIIFEVIDHEPRENSTRWERVVAVVCSGKLWQFKKYPFKGVQSGDMVEVFSNICGFYFHYSDTQVPDLVKSWNVTLLPLNRAERHTDIQTVQLFFDTLTKFIDQKSRAPTGQRGMKPGKLLYK